MVENLTSELSVSSPCSWSIPSEGTAPWLPSSRPLLKGGLCILNTLNILSRTVPCCRVCPVHCRMSSLCPLGARSTPSVLTIKNILRHHKNVAWGMESPQAENCSTAVSCNWECASGQQGRGLKTSRVPLPEVLTIQHILGGACVLWFLWCCQWPCLCPCRYKALVRVKLTHRNFHRGKAHFCQSWTFLEAKELSSSLSWFHSVPSDLMLSHDFVFDFLKYVCCCC